jgi:hypothetical protein
MAAFDESVSFLEDPHSPTRASSLADERAVLVCEQRPSDVERRSEE